ncbi:hypothetical protein EMIHUDRAFT_115317 [Emiliania huxleyi CCMP1516]|uniref:FYVE-type domain-containing protein n=2 Tax=Emiliania huxleyi TaxID=2903 RepID=A0A0D3JR78_EMIH1|nr:hypothetical protein EMIHUDRAFT_115317 [Emiliania huxleyi CCMP1516]EOD26013.1 hypothetical protein EMIHUDRAFT_115317 [Emiliania huxleyi CCMP1516]|eukprot:XP_005778442.1 hypothetical protein EMIHUDRAFT_115317 [Emiliania huxleyi CCMP1516]
MYMTASPAWDGCCFDCAAPCAEDPWASVNHAVRLCIRCAGAHRALGVHISFVRSLQLDELSAAEMATMARGGNDRCREFLEAKGVPRRVWLALALPLRYQTPAADLYRRVLAAEAAGEEVPTEMRAVALPPPPVAPAPERRASWTPDREAASCELCRQSFWLLQRRHHCRRCGRCVCGACSPPESARPLPQRGHLQPVRHCILCVPKPARPIAGIG